MIRSIKRFLLISLLISITVASSISAIGNYLLDKQVIQPYLDDQLNKIFSLVELLEKTAKNHEQFQQQTTAYFKQEEQKKHHLIFQAWNAQGKLIASIPRLQDESLYTAPPGFSDRIIRGNDWRVYAEYDHNKNKKVVAELSDVRDELADDITENDAYILLITYPLFGLLIWLIVGIALRSISRVSNEISNRASTYLEPVNSDDTPQEIKPLINELNQLFIRLKLAFDRNKRFSADAAHELRTPLAALKTHAQVALKSTDAAERKEALLKVIRSVDRSSHMVAQLLTLSKLSQEDTLNDIKPVDLHKIATETIAYLVPVALEKHIEIELLPAPEHTIIMGNDIALGVLVRNIVDNAIRYTPEQGEIKVQIISRDKQLIFRVTDSGPGVPVELRERIFERFYRMIGTTVSGSGLGLAIVSQIAELHHATIALNTPSNNIGLQFDVTFPRINTEQLS